MSKHNYKNKGYILMEALLAVVVLAMVVLSVVPMLSFLLRRTSQTRFEAQAGLLMQEAMEVTYNVLMSNWDAYPTDGTYHPGKSSGKWALFNSEERDLETLFTRSIEIKKVCRINGEVVDDINGCPGVRDPDSKYVTAKVTWDENGEEKVVSSTFMMVNMAAD